MFKVAVSDDKTFEGCFVFRPLPPTPKAEPKSNNIVCKFNSFESFSLC